MRLYLLSQRKEGSGSVGDKRKVRKVNRWSVPFYSATRLTLVVSPGITTPLRVWDQSQEKEGIGTSTHPFI